MFIARNDRIGSRSQILHHCTLRQWKITGTAKVIFHVLKFLGNGIETCMSANAFEFSVWLARLKTHNRYSVCLCVCEQALETQILSTWAHDLYYKDFFKLFPRFLFNIRKDNLRFVTQYYKQRGLLTVCLLLLLSWPPHSAHCTVLRDFKISFLEIMLPNFWNLPKWNYTKISGKN
jgi:hypothetical protein